LANGKEQEHIMNQIMALPGIEKAELSESFITQLWTDFVAEGRKL